MPIIHVKDNLGAWFEWKNKEKGDTMEEFTYKPTDEKPNFYENTIIYHLLQSKEEFIEVKIHTKTPEKYNNIRACVNIMMEKLASMLR